MPKGMQIIYRQIASGSAGQYNLNNIPQTYTDLKLVVSQRNASANLYESLAFRFDASSGSLYSNTSVYGDGSGISSNRVGGSDYLSYNGGLVVTGGNATANTFGSYEVYIPNYTSSAFKQFTIDAVTENNGANAHTDLAAGLYRSNAPITFIQIGGYTAQPAQYTSITLYGISR